MDDAAAWPLEVEGALPAEPPPLCTADAKCSEVVSKTEAETAEAAEGRQLSVRTNQNLLCSVAWRLCGPGQQASLHAAYPAMAPGGALSHPQVMLLSRSPYLPPYLWQQSFTHEGTSGCHLSRAPSITKVGSSWLST